jgi:GRIP domain
MLIQLHLREKHELNQANSLLREALQETGGASPEVAAVNAAIDKTKADDDALNDVLVLAAQTEIERLQEHVEKLSSELRSLQQQQQQQAAVAAGARLDAEKNNGKDGVVDHKALETEDGSEFDNKTESSTNSCSQCSVLQQQIARLSSALAEASAAKDLAEEQLAKSKERFSEMQSAQLEVVKLSQNERLQAEARCEEAETKAIKEANRAEQLAMEVKTFKERAEKAEASLQQERSKGAAKADATAAHQRARATELEMTTASLSQQLASSQAQVSALENRLAASESEAARAIADARDLESAASERDGLYARLAVAEARLEEGRAVQLSSASLRDMFKQSEAKRLAAEEELVATAKLAAELEERLVNATVSAEDALLEAQQAGVKASAAWGAIEAAVEERWNQAGNDRSKWPPCAQEEIEAVEARLSALNAAHKSLHEKLQHAETAKEAAEQRAVVAEQNAVSAEAGLERLARSSEQRERRLEAAALAATRQVDEFRSALSRLERERDQLVEDKKGWEEASRAASSAVAGARMRAGSGSISENGGGGEPSSISYLAPTPRRPGSSNSNGDVSAHLMDPTDLMYLRNVLLKFLGAHLENRVQECEVLLPALAAVLRASPVEYHKLKELHTKSHAVLGGWI